MQTRGIRGPLEVEVEIIIVFRSCSFQSKIRKMRSVRWVNVEKGKGVDEYDFRNNNINIFVIYFLFLFIKIAKKILFMMIALIHIL